MAKNNKKRKIKSRLKRLTRHSYTIAFACFAVIFWLYEGTLFVKGEGVLTDTVNTAKVKLEEGMEPLSEQIKPQWIFDRIKPEDEQIGETGTEADASGLSGDDADDEDAAGSEQDTEGALEDDPDAADETGEEDEADSEPEPPVIEEIPEEDVLSTEFVKVNDSYFDDALFIGDSRMMGIYDYCGWSNATFLCDNGYSIRNYAGGRKVTCQNERVKTVPEELLKSYSFNKVYIMLGTNDCPNKNYDEFEENYANLLNIIKEEQPDAVIYVVANLGMSKKGENQNSGRGFTNDGIKKLNEIISGFADGEKIFYLDFNPLFADEEGYLSSAYTFDGFHVTATQYSEMGDFFREHAVEYSVLPEQFMTEEEETADSDDTADLP